MKVTIAITALIAAVLASPATDTSPASMPKEVFLQNRAPCYHSSDCSWFYAAKCEQYCRQWGQTNGVARMEKCSLLNDKRCCCQRQ